MRPLTAYCSLLATILWCSYSQATLIDRGSGLIYDSDLDITWLADANYAFSSGYAAANTNGTTIFSDGRMDWPQANEWAASLTIGGFRNWRLPSTTQPDLSCSSQGVRYSAGDNFWGQSKVPE